MHASCSHAGTQKPHCCAHHHAPLLLVRALQHQRPSKIHGYGCCPFGTAKPLKFDPLKVQRLRCLADASASNGDGTQFARGSDKAVDVALPDTVEEFCIIESRDTVKNFANMQLSEMDKAINARQNKIFLLMEEIRRLRIQQRLRGDMEIAKTNEALFAEEKFNSSIPFFPPITEKTLKSYINLYIVAVSGIILFGGLLSPILEVKLGLGGTSYMDFIQTMHLPEQMALVDPIVASFCGGAVGVLTMLLVVEANNAAQQQRRRCFYCEGTGYLVCGNCIGVGSLAAANSVSTACASCAGTGKVMCTACLCTGKQMVTEHDPRIDPFSMS